MSDSFARGFSSGTAQVEGRTVYYRMGGMGPTVLELRNEPRAQRSAASRCSAIASPDSTAAPTTSATPRCRAMKPAKAWSDPVTTDPDLSARTRVA
jgi:hypothetical protein